MARKPKMAEGGLAFESATPNRQNFTLDEQRAESMRSALDDGGSVIEFWARMGQEIGFDPETIVLIDTPETGPVQFSAIPTAATEVNGAGEPIAEEVLAEEALDTEGRTSYEANHEAALDHMVRAVVDMDLASATLVGDITARLIEFVKRLPKPYDAHSPIEKRELISRLETISIYVVEQSVDIVAAEDRECVPAFLDKITAGEKVVISLKMSPMAEDLMSDAVSQLYRCQGKPVMIVTADSRGHMGKRREHLPPDQEDLPFDAGHDRAPPAPEHPSDDSDLNPFGKAPEAEAEVADSQVFWRSVSQWLKPGGKNWTADRKEAGVWRPTKATSLADELRDPSDEPHEIVKIGEEPCEITPEIEEEEEQQED